MDPFSGEWNQWCTQARVNLTCGDGDQVILFGYAGDETGKTKVRSLMVGPDAGGETAILSELKLGEVVTTFQTSGFGVETIEYIELEFHCVGRRRP